MKIYGYATFNVTKVLLTAEEIGLDYDYVALDLAKGEQKLPQHLAIHPLGKVPALVHKGRPVFESAAICRYLARISDSPLYGGDAYQLAMIDAWVDVAGHHIGRSLANIAFNEIVLHRMMGKPLNTTAIADAKAALQLELPPLERQLGENAYIVGEQLTIADTILASYMQVHEVASFDIEAWPNILRWYRGIRSSAAMERALRHFPGGRLFGL